MFLKEQNSNIQMSRKFKFRIPQVLSLSKWTLFLFLTFNFSLFTFHLGAQGVTKYGQSTSSSSNFVDKNGKIGSSAALSKFGQVFAVPGAPTGVTATAGNALATVAFSVPASNGGSTITSYTATSLPDGLTSTLTQAGSGTITVTGLSNYTAYTFTVTATNAIGTSTASSASNSVTTSPSVEPTDVLNPTTGKVWMDRNLGATQVAISSTDAASYGYLYQWGRGTDGHQSRTSASTGTLATSDTPGHSNFIADGKSDDWRNPQKPDLWQGVSGTNKPCPSGYRLPTGAEWEAERTSWVSNNPAGAFASPLKLPAAGWRHRDGVVYDVGVDGSYWSSTVIDLDSSSLIFSNTWGSFVAGRYRIYGFSVRCIKN
jgi:hypothetical protein